MIAGPLQTGITPNGHGHAGVNDQAAADGHIVADTLTSGSHPNSNMPGRRREDDTNIISAPLTASMGNNAAHPGNSGLDELASGPAAVGAGVRRLTPRECERLQGFPDDWTAIPGAPDSRRYAAMGDAVTVPVARWIGERLMQYGVSDQATQPRGAPERRSVDQSASSC